MKDIICFAVMLALLLSTASSQHRSPPGVPPKQYQPGQEYSPPQYQGQDPRYAPGVPPGQYQQQPQYQGSPQQAQYQGSPQQPHYQGSPQQPGQYQQNVPQQQYQAPASGQQYQAPASGQQYQAPASGQQYQAQQPHQKHSQPDMNVLHNRDLNEERSHIKEHLEVPMDISGMSEQELQYHYFKMHDADNNNKLDGQELIKSLFHWHDPSNHDPAKTGHSVPEEKLFTDEELIRMIDPILDQDDRNRDGFIDYPEFVQAQRNAAAAAAATGANAG